MVRYPACDSTIIIGGGGGGGGSEEELERAGDKMRKASTSYRSTNPRPKFYFGSSDT